MNGFEVKEGSFRLDIRKKLFTVREVRYWNRSLREAGDSPSLVNPFNTRLDGVLRNLV